MTWQRGRVVLQDHSLAPERALAALGARPTPCLALLAAWPAVPVAPRAFVDQLGFVDDDAPAGPWDPPAWLATAEWVAPTVGAGRRRAPLGGRQSAWAVQVLLSVPPPMASALAISAVVAVGRRWHDQPDGVQRAYQLALLARMRRAAVGTMAAWWGYEPAPLPDVDSRMVSPVSPRRMSGHLDRAGGQATVELPLSWLVTVWGKGLAVVDGCLVLEARHGAAGGEVEVDAVRWEPVSPLAAEAVTAPARAVPTGDGDWHLRWL